LGQRFVLQGLFRRCSAYADATRQLLANRHLQVGHQEYV